MKKLLFLLAILSSLVMTSCSNNSPRNDADIDATLAQLRADREHREKYELISLKENDREVTVYVKAGEKVKDMYVMTENSRDVEILFSPDRLFSIFFPKGEKIKSWGKHQIVTDRRIVAVHWYYE